MAVKRIRLEGLGKDIELASCKTRELDDLRRLVAAFLNMSDKQLFEETVQEIVDKYVPGLNPDDLTVDDIWEILMAKAGTYSHYLRRVPEISAEHMVNFLRNPAMSKAVVSQVEKDLQEQMTTGES